MRAIVQQEHYKVVVAKSVAEIDSLRVAWKTLMEREPSPVFRAEPDRFLAFLGTEPGIQPYVLLITRQDQPVALVVGNIQRNRIRCKIGYKSFSLPSLRCLTIMHGGLIGQITSEVAGVLLDEVKRFLRSSAVDAVFVNCLNTESSVYKDLSAKVSGLCRSRFHRLGVHRTMTVPESLEAFYRSRSKKHRANLRRYVRKIQEQYAGRVVVTRCACEADVDAFIDRALQVSVKTYQHGLGAGMDGDGRTRTLLRDLAARGWLRGHVMSIDGEPCAFQYGVLYRGTFFLEKMGFDPKWKDLNVGTVLFLDALQDLCGNAGATTIDFGFGDADYKRSYGDMHWMDASFYIFALRAQPLLANLIYSTTRGVSAGLADTLEKIHVAAWMKRHWRDQLQKKDEHDKQ